jgi:F0F1-type ATP synthase assembly protein I
MNGAVMVQPGSNLPDERMALSRVAPLLTSGMQLALAVVVFFFMGYWLDGEFGTTPWCSIGGGLLGVAGGLTKFLRDAMALGKKADEELKEIKSHRRED